MSADIWTLTIFVWGIALAGVLILLALAAIADKLAGWLHKRRQNRRLRW